MVKSKQGQTCSLQYYHKKAGLSINKAHIKKMIFINFKNFREET